MDHGRFSLVEKGSKRRACCVVATSIVMLIALGSSSSIAALPNTAAVVSDICTSPVFQAKLIEKFNSVPQFTQDHGALQSVANLHNEIEQSISCKGTYRFADGTTKVMAFGFVPDGTVSTIAGGIPNHCNTNDTWMHIEHEVPRILDMGSNRPGISKVEFLHDTPRLVYYPAVKSAPSLSMLQCPVKITWTNGREDAGYYMEWQDHHQQVRASFTSSPIEPPTNDY